MKWHKQLSACITGVLCIGVSVMLWGQNNTTTSCNDRIQVTLGNSCQAVITADMVLEGISSENLADYQVSLFSERGRPISNPYTSVGGKESIFAKVVHLPSGYACTTIIDLEDKTAPVATNCQPEIREACVSKNIYSLSTTLQSPTVHNVLVGSSDCLEGISFSSSCDPVYTQTALQVTHSNWYTVNVLAASELLGLTLYQGGFHPLSQCQNLIAAKQQAADGSLSMVAYLEANQTYTLLSLRTQCQTTPLPITYEIYSGGDGGVQGITPTSRAICLPLWCADVAEIVNNPNSLNYLPSPVFEDNCTPANELALTFTDTIETTELNGNTTIRRTWKATDKNGLTSAPCVQRIYLRSPDESHIVWPARTVPIYCGVAYPQLPNGHPNTVIGGEPLVFDAFSGFRSLSKGFCKLAATYEDIFKSSACPGSESIVRRWSLFDWSKTETDKRIATFDQFLKIGDFEGPLMVLKPDSTLVFSTGGLDCYADVTLPAPVSIRDVCNSAWNLEVSLWQIQLKIEKGKLEDIFHLQETLIAKGKVGEVVNNLLPGEYTLRYKATDDCNNTSYADAILTIRDNVAPVASCDNRVHVSLGGEGIARLTANDINEGSWDNCQLDTLLVRRAFSDTFCLRQHAVEVLNLDLDSLIRTDTGYVHKGIKVYELEDGVPYTFYASETHILCCDVAKNVKIELLARDTAGNTSTCWMSPLIEDKLKPICYAPRDTTVNCLDIQKEYSADTTWLQATFGKATFRDNCGPVNARELDPTFNIKCGAGTIVRRFQGTDASGNTSECQQRITIQKGHHYSIKFPKDVTGECTRLFPDSVQVFEKGCDQLVVSLKEEQIGSNKGCFTLRRTWQVMNWCEYDGESKPVVIGRDEDCDGEFGDEDVYVHVGPNGDVFIDADNNPYNNFPAAGTKRSSCDGSSNPEGYWIDKNGAHTVGRNLKSVGFWEYQQILTVTDKEPPRILTPELTKPFCINSPDSCFAEINFPFAIAEACSFYRYHNVTVTYIDTETGRELKDAFNTGYINHAPKYFAKGRYNEGKHRVKIVAEDGCGNSDIQFVDFEVISCRGPELICIQKLAAELVVSKEDVDGDGRVDFGVQYLKATDFVASLSRSCPRPTDTLTVSLHRLNEVPNKKQQSLTITCKDYPTLPLRVYAWDNRYNPFAVQPDGTVGGPNYTFCDVIVNVQDNQFGLCLENSSPLQGFIRTEDGKPIPMAAIHVNQNPIIYTDNTGLYARQLERLKDYSVRVSLEDNPVNGITTFDLVAITKHIQGIKKLNSPYKLIAADVNKSRSVSILDLVQMRKLILGIDTVFKQQTSWNFIPQHYVFPNPENPWQENYPTVMNFNNLTKGVLDADFVGIKIGDVTLDADLPLSRPATIRSQAKAVLLSYEDQTFKANNPVNVVLRLQSDEILEGLQANIHFDVSVLGFEGFGSNSNNNELVAASFATHQIQDGVLRAAWADPANPVRKGETWVTLQFTARRNGKLSDVLRLSDRGLQNEAYARTTTDISRHPLHLVQEAGTLNKEPKQHNNSTVNTNFISLSATPNPFADRIVISWRQPLRGVVSFVATDALGKVVWRQQANAIAGEQQLSWQPDVSLPGGLYIIRMEGQGIRQSVKVVRL